MNERITDTIQSWSVALNPSSSITTLRLSSSSIGTPTETSSILAAMLETVRTRFQMTSKVVSPSRGRFLPADKQLVELCHCRHPACPFVNGIEFGQQFVQVIGAGSPERPSVAANFSE